MLQDFQKFLGCLGFLENWSRLQVQPGSYLQAWGQLPSSSLSPSALTWVLLCPCWAPLLPRDHGLWSCPGNPGTCAAWPRVPGPAQSTLLRFLCSSGGAGE